MPNRRLLVVDDSSTICALIEQIFADQSDITLVGTVKCAEDAIRAIADLRPDVMTLDFAMPGMDGLELLGAIMRDHPLAVVMVSSSSAKGSMLSHQAMDSGASCCFDKAYILKDRKAFMKAVRSAKRGRVRETGGSVH